VLYNLTRINEELKGAQISILGISNDTTLTENMDIRVKSSLSEEDVFFTLYNAVEMKSILQERASKAFHENAIEQGVIEKCAAYAAREHGDARKAIELLRVAGELAERSKNEKVSFEHIDEAEEKLEREKIFDIIKTQPKQFQAVLYSIITLKNKNSIVYTGEIYDLYKKICFKIGLRPLTQRRVSDIIGEFELIGIINTKTISKGRYGRTREITMSIPSSTNPLTKKILEEELSIA
jgi:cell division control protein 6